MTSTQVTPKLLTVREFLEFKPDNNRFELHNGAIVDIAQPLGGHEEVIGFLARKLTVEFDKLDLPYFIPKTALVQSPSSESTYSPDILILNLPALKFEELWEKYSTVASSQSIPLIVEVVSTNWRDDYNKNLGEYEEIGIPEYWIVEDTALDGSPGLKHVSVDYLGLGGIKFLGNPKQPTISIYRLIGEEYQVTQFRDNDLIVSPTFPNLNLTANQIFDVGSKR